MSAPEQSYKGKAGLTVGSLGRNDEDNPEAIEAIRGAGAVLPCAPLSQGGDSQQVAIVSGSTASAVISARRIIVSCTQPCFIRRGINPTAVNTGADRYLVSDAPYVLKIEAGDKVAVIKPSGGVDGVAYITPIGVS